MSSSELDRQRREVARKRPALVSWERPMAAPARRRERSLTSYLISYLIPMLLVALGSMLFVVGHWVWP